MKKLLVILALLFAGTAYFNSEYGALPDRATVASRSAKVEAQESAVARAFARQESNVQVSGEGVVLKILPDDNNGSRHQRFIVKMADGQTVLIAHNIDLAPRIGGLAAGDVVGFNGEYEWNAKGGVVHWTHHDPKGRHAPGSLQHRGRIYQ